MAEQPTLFTPPPATGKLTERQLFVYELLAGHPVDADGSTADEVGAELHERAGKHSAGVRCQWCSQDGVGVLKALKKKGLVRRRRGGTWQALGQADEEARREIRESGASACPSAQDGPGGFPSGF